jgi:hypothetical protein
MEPSMMLAILAIALGPSIIVFLLGCALAVYRTHRPQLRRRSFPVQDRRPT